MFRLGMHNKRFLFLFHGVLFFSPEDVLSMISGGKIEYKYVGPEVEAMKDIALSLQNRSLAEFKKVDNLQFYLPYLCDQATNNGDKPWQSWVLQASKYRLLLVVNT